MTYLVAIYSSAVQAQVGKQTERLAGRTDRSYGSALAVSIQKLSPFICCKYEYACPVCCVREQSVFGESFVVISSLCRLGFCSMLF